MRKLTGSKPNSIVGNSLRKASNKKVAAVISAERKLKDAITNMKKPTGKVIQKVATA